MRFLFSVLALFAILSGVRAGTLEITGNGVCNGKPSTNNVPVMDGIGAVTIICEPKTENQHSKVRAEHIASQSGNFPSGFTFAQAPVGWFGSGFLNSLQFEKAYTKTPDASIKYYGTFSAPLTDASTTADKDTWWQSLDLLSSSIVGGASILLPNIADFHYWPSQVSASPPFTRTPYDYIVFQMPASFIAQDGVVAYVTWCNPATQQCTPPSGGSGDPQFVGLQGQNYQFHGMADEVFSLVSTPELQMSSLFKFIANGNCEYNNTVCWSHPGTYLGQISIQYADVKILLQSGSHSEGATVLVNDKVIAPSTHVHKYHLSANSTMTMSFGSAQGDIIIQTPALYFRIVNSDYFFNLDFGIKDSSILTAGAKKLSVTGEVCERESRSVIKTQTGKISEMIKATYPAIPMHGLLGQTWRNAIYCGRYFEGTVDDYVTGGLFSNEHTFNYFNKH